MAEDVFELYVAGRAAFDAGDLDGAERRFRAMLRATAVSSDGVTRGHASVGLAQVALARHHLAEVAEHLETADAAVEDVEGELRGRLLVNISALWDLVGNRERSRTAWERLVELLDGPDVDGFLQGHELLIGGVDLALRHGELAAAERLLARAEEHVADRGSQADCSFWRARIASQRGDPSAARLHFEEAASAAEGEMRLMALANSGRMAYEAGNLAAAERTFRDLLEEASVLVDARGLSEGYAGLAQIEYDRNRLDEARLHAKNALASASFSGDDEATAVALTAAGIVWAKLGELAEAAEAYAELRALLEAVEVELSADVRRRAEAALESNEAQLALRRGEPDALQRLATVAPRRSLPEREELDDLLQSGVAAFLTGEAGRAKRVLRSAFVRAQQTGYPAARHRAGFELAVVYAAQRQFEPAHRACRDALEALEPLRARAGAEATRLVYLRDKAGAYALMIKLCLVLADLQRRRPRQREAVEYVERAKSRALADALGAIADLPLPAAVPGDLRAAEADTMRRVRELERRSRGEGAEAEYAFAEAQASLDELVARIGAFAPEYASLRRGAPVTFTEMRSLVATAGADALR